MRRSVLKEVSFMRRSVLKEVFFMRRSVLKEVSFMMNFFIYISPYMLVTKPVIINALPLTQKRYILIFKMVNYTAVVRTVCVDTAQRGPHIYMHLRNGVP